MDILDDGLDGSHVKDEEQVQLVVEGDDEEHAAIASVTQGLTLDPTVQYQLRTDTAQGAVTYRVIQVPDNSETSSNLVSSATAYPALTSSLGSSPSDPLGSNDAKLTYISSLGSDSLSSQSNEITANSLSNAGQLYVMMSPQDVLQGQRTIAPRSHTMPRLENNRTGRDEKRRATHNEVERRRRDKINNWIVQLSKIIPECSDLKHGQVSITKSKGGILSKACDYIMELRSKLNRTHDNHKEVDTLQRENEALRQDNRALRRLLQRHGIDAPPDPVT